ncbi:hypothetical protein CNMCM5793_006322 [Aspergillus hiratsukae]|uniref:Uncharacterized protein n=1 Tax=Aspergillus hiratsukae TaxID=1194566 RepID=A0A8H6PI10_9EURO|nr:hypothetical protein CNMCM5793_006322 [Aspergillus hiratsukae]
MRFFAPLLAILAVGAIAADSAADEEYSTVIVTETTTYCPKATSSAVPSITVSNGVTYSISRPLITSTITKCNKWYANPSQSYYPVVRMKTD